MSNTNKIYLPLRSIPICIHATKLSDSMRREEVDMCITTKKGEYIKGYIYIGCKECEDEIRKEMMNEINEIEGR